MDICSVCRKNGGMYCSNCYSTRYCSQECQRKDWTVHKTACLRIADTTKSNPWYAQVSPSEPKFVPPEFLQVEQYSNGKFSEFIDGFKSPRVNTTRGARGESLLHLAVIFGDIEAVEKLLSRGAYVNCCDWWKNDPLYYACSHSGTLGNTNDTTAMNLNNKPNTESQLGKNRLEIVKHLVSAGADTMRQGGYSGFRSFEAARYYGYPDVAEYIENSPECKKLQVVRELINAPREKLTNILIVKHLVDVIWRGDTCHWLIQPNRAQMGLCINPHPDLLYVKIDDREQRPTLDHIEAMFVDLSARHNRLFRELMSGE